MKTKPEVKHTPTPWKIDYAPDKTTVDLIYGADNADVIKTDNGVYPPYSHDAEFIVRAVNSYENDCTVIAKLGHEVERLEKIKEALLAEHNASECYCSDNPKGLCEWCIADKAIVQAEGKVRP